MTPLDGRGNHHGIPLAVITCAKGVGANLRTARLLRFLNLEKRGQRDRREGDSQPTAGHYEDSRGWQTHEAVAALWKTTRRPHANGVQRAAEGQRATSATSLC